MQNFTQLAKSTVKEFGKIHDVYNDEEISRPEKLRTYLSRRFTSEALSHYPMDYGDEINSDPLEYDPVLDILPTDADGISIPVRMFDLESQNMVSTTTPGKFHQYCILSHSWKGDEVTYGYVTQAQKLRGSKEFDPEDTLNDVDAVMIACEADIEKHEKAIMELEGCSDISGLNDLICGYIRALRAENARADATKQGYKAYTAWKQGQKEKEHYGKLVQNVQQLPTLHRYWVEVGNKMDEANLEMDRARKRYDEHASYLERIRSRFRLHNALTEMISALQRRKSARKLKESIRSARDIFNTRPFIHSPRRYIWLDNTSINKNDNNELTESLARMGEWYANAEFCLVHLDTPFDHNDWLDEWGLWMEQSHGWKDVPRAPASETKAPLTEYLDIKHWKPVWATRGWTLQELLLSKITYYVNPQWELLPRGVDALGWWYYVAPFYQLYTHSQKYTHAESESYIQRLKTMLEKNEIQKKLDEACSFKREGRGFAESIVAALLVIGVLVPARLNLDNDGINMKKSIAKTIRTQAQSMDRSDQSISTQVKDTVWLVRQIYDGIAYPGHEADSEEENRKVVKLVIDILIIALQQETLQAIRDDRHYISEFGGIDYLPSWTTGTAKLRFSAHSVMNLASAREVTKPIDTAYSMMGILGVRFPAFPAEGLTRALSRLIDEVITQSNDVSVFNWSGKHWGSQIRGRSLYPSNIRAFFLDDPLGLRRAHVDIELANVFTKDRQKDLQTSEMLYRMLYNAAVYLRLGNLRSNTIEKIGEFVSCIKRQSIKDLHRLLGAHDLIEAWDEAKKSVDYHHSPARNSVSDDNDSSWREKNSPPFDSLGQSSKKIPSRFRLKGMSRLNSFRSLYRMTQDTINNLENKRDPSLTRKIYQDGIEEGVTGAIEPVLEEFYKPNLPEEDAHEVHFENPSSPLSSNHEVRNDQQLTCSNPIVINSSGIKGVFDIHRVVVTMLHPEMLRTAIRQAMSDYERIEGTCTLSTGLAFTTVSFSCEKHILAQQMDLVEVVEKTALKAQEQTHNDWYSTENPGTGIERNENPTLSIEQERVSRMVDFIQEPSLEAIAGEWVLARVSGCPGAKWFLCRLELGVRANEFYARRIATDEFDFEYSMPESGLVEYWHMFFSTRKALICDIVSCLLDAKCAVKYADTWSQTTANQDDLSSLLDDSDDKEMAELSYQPSTIRKLARTIIFAGRGVASERSAEYLEGNLQQKAMAQIPARLRSVVLALNERKAQLPRMIHSAVDAHFF